MNIKGSGSQKPLIGSRSSAMPKERTFPVQKRNSTSFKWDPSDCKDAFPIWLLAVNRCAVWISWLDTLPYLLASKLIPLKQISLKTPTGHNYKLQNFTTRNNKYILIPSLGYATIYIWFQEEFPAQPICH